MNNHTYETMCKDVAVESLASVVASIFKWIVDKLKALMTMLGLRKRNQSEINKKSSKELKAQFDVINDKKGMAPVTPNWVWSNTPFVFNTKDGRVAKGSDMALVCDQQLDMSFEISRFNRAADEASPKIVEAINNGNATALRRILNSLCEPIVGHGSVFSNAPVLPNGSIVNVKGLRLGLLPIKANRTELERTIPTPTLEELKSINNALSVAVLEADSLNEMNRLPKRLTDTVEKLASSALHGDSEQIATMVQDLVVTITTLNTIATTIVTNRAAITIEMSRILKEGYK